MVKTTYSMVLWGVAALVLVMAGVVPVQAEGLLSVAPLRIFLSDTQTSEVLTLSNRSGKEQTFKVTMEDQVMHEDGNIVSMDDFPYSAKRMLRFMPRQITLQPGQRQTVRVMAIPPEGLAEGEYHTHLLFDEVIKQKTEEATELGASQPGFKMKMEAAHSVGIPLIYRHGKITAELTLKAGKLVVQKNNRPAVQVTLERSGNGEASGQVRVVEVGKEDVNLVPQRNMHVYREADKVTITLPMKDDVATTLQALQQMKLQVRLEREGQQPDVVEVGAE